MGVFTDLTGMVFGKLTVIEKAEVVKKRGAVWICKCECGEVRKVAAYNLKNGNSTSCGCKSLQRITSHGFASRKLGGEESGTYHVWESLKQRITKPNCKAYKNYGGRGIKIDPRWSKFDNFLNDMGVRPKGYSLDRIDNDGDYTPNNCRWASKKEQCSNTRRNRLFEYEGEKVTISEISRRTGINISRLRHRIIVQGLDLNDAISNPVRRIATGTGTGV